jgi:hypothetical protein
MTQEAMKDWYAKKRETERQVKPMLKDVERKM